MVGLSGASQGRHLFLNHGRAPKEVRGKSGERALHVAVNSGVPLVRLLPERGVDVLRRGAAGQTALAHAKRKTRLVELPSRSQG